MTDQTSPITPIRYRFIVKYYIVDPFGDLLCKGVAEISQELPLPTGEAERLLHEAQTAQTVRRSCDTNPEFPPGRVLIAAILPQGTA